MKDNLNNDRRMIELTDQFEEAWNSGQRISADDFFARFSDEETWQELHEELRLVEQELLRKYPPLQRIGNYEILERIGRGGMGEVYRARHVLMDKIVAVKVVQDKIAEIPEAVKRFERELKLIGNLSHPNIVQAHGAEQIDEKLLLAMEFIDGESLQQLITSGKKMPIDEAIAIVRQVATGLQYAHERKIVHRDIKPGNIMLTADGTAKILDFGLGKFYSERSDSSGQFTQTGTPVGTLDYTSPEQCRDPGGVDIRTDIYALGCTFYTIVVGEVPYPSSKFSGYTAKILAHIDQPPPSFSASGVVVSPDIETLLQKMCAKDHEQRFATPQELVNFIDDYQRSDVRTGAVPVKQRIARGWAVVGIVAACLLVWLFILPNRITKIDGTSQTDMVIPPEPPTEPEAPLIMPEVVDIIRDMAFIANPEIEEDEEPERQEIPGKIEIDILGFERAIHSGQQNDLDKSFVSEQQKRPATEPQRSTPRTPNPRQ